MKIGIDARTLYTDNLRGIGTYLFQIIEHAIKIDKGLQFVLFHNHSCDTKHIPQSKAIVEKQCEVKKGDRFYLWEQMKIPLEMTRVKLDLYHAPANTAPFFQPAPTVITVHDTLLMELDEDETKGYLFYYRHFMPFAIKRAKRIITISEYSKKEIMKRYKVREEKIKVIYNGISRDFRILSDKSLIESAKNHFNIKGEYIFALGARAPRKNTHMVLRAFKSLRKRLKRDIKLVLAGMQKDALGECEKEVKDMGLGNEVVTLGFISKNDLVSLYNGAELFLYLSLYEGFGFPALEALACGCPVIGSNRTSIPELLNDRDFVVDPTNEDAIVEASLLFLKNKEFRNNKINIGVKRAKQFDWELSAKKVIAVYRECLK